MSILEQLKHNLDALDLFEGIGVEAYLQRPSREKWSAHENLAHLGRYQEMFSERVEKMLREDSPEFGRYRAEEDQGFLQWVALSTTDVMKELQISRGYLLRKLENLNEDDFARICIHPLYGEMTLTQWLQFFLIHESHHLYTALYCAKSVA
jgi:uncharacterized damage-inducible protein DinB